MYNHVRTFDKIRIRVKPSHIKVDIGARVCQNVHVRIQIEDIHRELVRTVVQVRQSAETLSHEFQPNLYL